MNKRYTPTCFFAHIGVYQHRSPSVPETGKRQRGYVYPQRIGCGEHRFNRGFAPLEQSIGKPGIDTGLGGKVVGVPGMVRGLSSDFVQDLVPYEAKFAESVRDHEEVSV